MKGKGKGEREKRLFGKKKLGDYCKRCFRAHWIGHGFRVTPERGVGHLKGGEKIGGAEGIVEKVIKVWRCGKTPGRRVRLASGL